MVPSPCVAVCRIDPKTGWCCGCRRTLDEIRNWAFFSDEQKRSVIENLSLRPIKGLPNVTAREWETPKP